MILLILLIPIILWSISYIYIAFYYKRFNILNISIHESGRHTFLGTVFYFNHFLRELFIDTIFVFCIYWTYVTLIPEHLTYWRSSLSSYSIFIASSLLLFLLFIFVGSFIKVGIKNSLLDLFQYRELDTVINYGSHWKMHILSTVFIILMLISPATLVVDINLIPLLSVLLIYFLLTVVFGLDKKSLVDKRWLMHGGREILTFFLIGFLPAYLPILLIKNQINYIKPTYMTLLIFSLLFLIFLYIIKIFITTNVKKLAQGNFGFSYLISSHFFEHTLDFIYMFLLTLLLITMNFSI